MDKKHIKEKKKAISLNLAHLLVLIFMVVVLIAVLNYTGTTQKVMKNVNGIIKNNSSQENIGKDDNSVIKWGLNDDGVLTISGTGKMKDNANITKPMPEQDELNLPWYKDVEKIKKVVIGYGVGNISDNSFVGCSNLTEITIPSSVTSISSTAFSGCNKLNQIITDKDSTYVTKYATDNNIAYKVITETKKWNIGKDSENSVAAELSDDGVLTIRGIGEMKDNANITKPMPEQDLYNLPWYKYVDDIQKIIIEYGVTNISENAFAGCSNLTEITIPSTVTSISSTAFSGCNKLNQIITDKDNTYVTNYAKNNNIKYQLSTDFLATVSYSTTSLTNQNVTVTITANREVTQMTQTGWIASTDKKILTKTYAANATETITLKDALENTVDVEIKITNIDKTAPTVTVKQELSADKKSNKVTITAN